MAPEQAGGRRRRGRPGGRRLLARRDPLRAADRPPAVPRRDGAATRSTRSARPSRSRPAGSCRACRATSRRSCLKCLRRTPPGGTPRPRTWPTTCAASSTAEPDPRPADRRAHANREVGETPPGPGRLADRLVPLDARRHRRVDLLRVPRQSGDRPRRLIIDDRPDPLRAGTDGVSGLLLRIVLGDDLSDLMDDLGRGRPPTWPRPAPDQALVRPVPGPKILPRLADLLIRVADRPR